eukprot:10068223-Lingulodinium_polyedra.AAC.1
MRSGRPQAPRRGGAPPQQGGGGRGHLQQDSSLLRVVRRARAPQQPAVRSGRRDHDVVQAACRAQSGLHQR